LVSVTGASRIMAM